MNCLRNLVVIGGIAAAAAMIATGFAAVAPAVTAQTEPEIIVRGGEVFTEGSLQAADVRIVGETIAEIGTGLAARDAGTQEIDAGGLLVLPGGIDPHVHLGGNRVDDYTSGSAAALAGGITTISNFGGVAGGETPTETLARPCRTYGPRPSPTSSSIPSSPTRPAPRWTRWEPSPRPARPPSRCWLYIGQPPLRLQQLFRYDCRAPWRPSFFPIAARRPAPIPRTTCRRTGPPRCATRPNRWW